MGYVNGRDKVAREDERLRRLLSESAPHFRDAVIAGFAEMPENMRGVATEAMLDKLASNALALRLGDERFDSEICAGLLAQAVRTAERWEDVDINVRLSCIRSRSTFGAPRLDAQLLFDAVVTWKYTATLGDRVRRFTATDNPDEFRECLSDGSATASWYIPTGSGDPSDRASCEVLSYGIDGVELPSAAPPASPGRPTPSMLSA